MNSQELKNKISEDYKNASENERKGKFIEIAKSMNIKLHETPKGNRYLYENFISGSDLNALFLFFTDPFNGCKEIEENLFYNIYFTNPNFGEYNGF
jgi:hypothetical protein